MYAYTQSIAFSKEDMAHIEALVEGGEMRCSCCRSTSWDPPQPRLAIVNDVLLGPERLEKEPPTVVLSINCAKCGKRESFDYHRLATYAKTARGKGNLGKRVRRGIQGVKSMIAGSPFNPVLSKASTC